MSGRIKILLAVLAVGTGLVFWYALNYSDNAVSSAFLSEKLPQQIASADKDTDSDGLSDAKETYWGTDFKNPDTDGDGFKDGEEVITGHNPAKKGPDDLLNNKTNLTQHASAMLLGGLTTGDLDPSSPNYQTAIDALVGSIFEQYTANTATELDSIVTGDNDQNELSRYGIKMSRIMPSLFSDTAAGFVAVIATVKDTPVGELSTLRTKNPDLYARFTAAIDAQLVALDAQATAFQGVRVPPTMLTTHRNILLFLCGIQQQYRAFRAIDRDPLQGIIAMQMLATLTTDTSAKLSADFATKLSKAFTQ